MRSLLALAALAVLGALALGGCGTNFPLPTETRTGRGYSTDNSYQMVATWSFDGSDSIADILLTQGPGTQLFLLFNHAGFGPAPRGAVHAFALKARPPRPAPLPGMEFRSLFVPAALCAGGSRVFVLDQGDTALARDPVTGRVTDLSTYWRVCEFGLLGGDPISTFTDTSLAFVRGVAADDQERVYVSGSAIVLIPDPQDPRIRTRTFQFRVNRYRRAGPGDVPDPYMPGSGLWIRDQSFIVEEGSGLGTLTDPRGLYWSGPGAPGGAGLFAADLGKNWVQKLSDAVSSTGLFKLDADSSSTLNGPADVAADLAGFIYLTDTGNRRVLRYDPYGEFVQRVDVELDSDGQPLADPVAVAADDSLVYVADRAANKVIRYQRRR
jgi:DNA-binding beta-propeller fold protein YncE